MAAGGVPPDHLRCRRSDGRQWRCVRRAMENKGFCDVHFLQSRCHQTKQPVPLSMKLQRKRRYSALKARKFTPATAAASAPLPKRPCKILGKFKKKENSALWLQLVSMVLRRLIEKDQCRRSSVPEREENLLVRNLPNGTMSISPRPQPSSNNAANSTPPCDKKLGLDENLVLRRCFRSKNVESVPLSGFRVVPCSRKLKSKCHQCGKAGVSSYLRCSKCEKELYCKNCFQLCYSQMSAEEFEIACPLCRGCCTCKNCINSESKVTGCKELTQDEKVVDRILNAHYMICLLLPILKQINQDQKTEFDVESRLPGSCPSVALPQADCDANLLCDYCKASIVDIHRSCSNCSFNLCINCCQEIRTGNLLGGIGKRSNRCIKSKTNNRCEKLHSKTGRRSIGPEWEVNQTNRTIPCPPKELGGCGKNILELRCIFPLNWMQNLEIIAEEIACSYDLPALLDIPSRCSLCSKSYNNDEVIDGNLREASWRADSDDNYLYSPSMEDIKVDGVEHFQQHWIRGHPVIVRDIVGCTTELSWDPLVLFQSLLGINETDTKMVDINIENQFNGYLRGQIRDNLCPNMRKLMKWPPSCLFRKQLPKHYAEVEHGLPFQEYTHPSSGYFNLAVKLPSDLPKPELGPWMDIFDGFGEGLGQANPTAKLRVGISDVVNVLMHTSELATAERQIGKIENKKRRLIAKDEMESFGRSFMHQITVDKIKSEPLLFGEILRKQKKLREGPKNGESVIHFKREKLLDAANCDEVVKCEVGDRLDPEENKRPPQVGEEEINHPSGVQWDIFRREDVSKLAAYLNKNFNISRHNGYSLVKHASHPIHDRCFFLDTAHKRRLKEEFEVEPWTFVQHAGEAVIIPAGCPYQLKNFKCCTKVVIDFISPESGWECIQLVDELRLLPGNHKAKQNTIEVKKMILHSINAAVEEIRDLTSS